MVGFEHDRVEVLFFEYRLGESWICVVLGCDDSDCVVRFVAFYLHVLDAKQLFDFFENGSEYFFWC